MNQNHFFMVGSCDSRVRGDNSGYIVCIDEKREPRRWSRHLVQRHIIRRRLTSLMCFISVVHLVSFLNAPEMRGDMCRSVGC